MTYAPDPWLVTWLPVYNAFVCFHRVFYLFTLLMNVYFFARLASARRIHVNFRIVLCSAALSFEVLGGTRLAVQLLAERSVGARERPLLNAVCLLLSNVHMVAVFGSVLCMNVVAVEQHLATVWVRDYEKRTCTIGVILIGLVFVQCVPLAVLLNWWYLRDEFDLRTVRTVFGSCLAVDLHWELALAGFTACTITCTAAALWMEHLKKKNRRLTQKRLALKSLSARFQQTENSTMTAAIAPSLLGYMLMAFCGFVLSFTRKYFVDAYGEGFLLNRMATDFGYMLFDIYSLFHMCCFLYCTPCLRHQVRKDLCSVLGLSPRRLEHRVSLAAGADSEGVTHTYFSQLKRSWQ